MVPKSKSCVKTKHPHFTFESAPEMAEFLWRGYCETEEIASKDLIGGLARARTRLLDGIPNWQLPAFLEALGAGGVA